MKFEVDWSKMTPKHNIHIPEHDHKMTDYARDNLATMLVEHRESKRNRFIKWIKQLKASK